MKFTLNEDYILKYDFDSYSGDYFEYGINEYDAYYDLIATIGKDKLIQRLNDYIDFKLDPNYDEDDQLIELFSDHLDLFIDELTEIYYDDALEEFQDSKLNDYEYSGMNQDDF